MFEPFLVLFVELGGYLIDMNIVSFRSMYLSFDIITLIKSLPECFH